MTIEHLQAQRAAIPEDGALPASTTRDELVALQAQRLALDRRIRQAREAMATLAALGTADADAAWRDHLTAWRAVLCDELLAIKSPIRDPKTMGKSRSLSLSIRCIDFGLRVVEDTGYDLTTLRLGELMREAGYAVEGADPDRHYAGTMPWHGSLPEVEQRIEDLTKRRERAQAALDDALLDDDERAAQEAAAKAKRDELNARPVRKVRGDGSQYDKYPDGRRVEVTR